MSGTSFLALICLGGAAWNGWQLSQGWANGELWQLTGLVSRKTKPEVFRMAMISYGLGFILCMAGGTLPFFL